MSEGPLYSVGHMVLRREDGRPYLERWRFSSPRFRVFLHRMKTEDPGRDLHSHPWSFSSLVLWGGYDEQVEDVSLAAERAASAAASIPGFMEPGDTRSHGWLRRNHIPLNMAHRITRLHRPTTWTLVWAGRKERYPWGFYSPQGFVPFYDYGGHGLIYESDGSISLDWLLFWRTTR